MVAFAADVSETTLSNLLLNYNAQLKAQIRSVSFLSFF